MTATHKTALATLLAILAGIAIFEMLKSSRLQEQLQALQQQQTTMAEQLAKAKSEGERLSSQSQDSRSPSMTTERLRELLRLRGEVARLRRRQQDMEQALAAGQSQAPGHAAQSGVADRGASGAPFQVRLVSDNPAESTEPMTNNATGAQGETLQVEKAPLMDYTAIRSTSVTRNSSSGAPEIDLEFSDEGKDLFAAITRDNINKRLAIVLDGQLFSAPIIRSEIGAGNAKITGQFTEDEARMLAVKINDAIRGQ